MVAGLTVIVLALSACADPAPADLIRAEWPAYSGTYEVRDFTDGDIPRVHRETIDFSDADHWQVEASDGPARKSQVGSRYCEWHGDALRCEEVEHPLAPSFWLQQGWPRRIPGDVAEQWSVDRDGGMYVARLVLERACRHTVKPELCGDAEQVVSNEYVVRFDRYGIPYHWYETVDGRKTREAEFVDLVVDGDLVIADDGSPPSQETQHPDR